MNTFSQLISQVGIHSIVHDFGVIILLQFPKILIHILCLFGCSGCWFSFLRCSFQDTGVPRNDGLLYPHIFTGLDFWNGIRYESDLPPAGKNRWFKIAGIASLGYGLVLLMGVTGGIIFPTSPVTALLGNVIGWLATAGSLAPVLLSMHFQHELRDISFTKGGATASKFIPFVPGLLVMLALLFTLALGFLMTSVSYNSVYWGKQNFERAKQLVRLSEGHTFVSDKDDTLFYRLIKPLHYDATKKYPLVVSLPYGGSPKLIK